MSLMMMVTVDYKSIDKIKAIQEKYKARIKYNSYNLGEFGEFVRINYAENIIDDLLYDIIENIDMVVDK